MIEIDKVYNYPNFRTKELSDDFFQEEIRCDYIINRQMKKVWSVLLGLLDCFQQVCKEHNLNYWAIQGTLLGAVRHKGFIPWDDDMDVCMPRHDYEILLAHPEWIKAPYQLHISNNNENYYEGWLRVHDTRTAVLYPNYKEEGSKQGIYIDIFPLDYATLSDKNRRKRIQIVNNIGHAVTYNVNPSVLAKTVSKIARTTGICKPETLFKKINALAKKHESEEMWGFIALSLYPLEKSIFPVKDFHKTIQMPFENTTVNVPEGYDDILRINYGNYMEFPPVSKRGQWHTFSFDTENSFRSYNKK